MLRHRFRTLIGATPSAMRRRLIQVAVAAAPIHHDAVERAFNIGQALTQGLGN
jgi:hypothetical protein